MAHTAGRTAGIPDREERPERVRRFRLTVVEGATRGTEWVSSGDSCSVGSHLSNDFVIANDATVSRFHCDIKAAPDGFVVRDLESRNGTVLDGVRILAATPRGGSMIRVGQTVLRFDFERTHNLIQVHPEPRFGELVAESAAMRSAFALLDRAARTDATVLIEGETGTGKELAARAIHRASPRHAAPFIVVDCGAIPDALLESELFGHERGAFTGADARRTGAFEEAHGGTIFLDEIGELPTALQPKLLRALERKEVRRVGSNTHRVVDVRIVAATNRDLRRLVNDGGFRPDLFYRLCVVRVVIPPLREHPEDIPLLVRTLLAGTGAAKAIVARLTAGEFIGSLQRSAWPGNVRELRNFIERCLVLEQALPLGNPGSATSRLAIDPDTPYAASRRAFLEQFERAYAEAVMARHDGNVTQAARAAGIGRVSFHRLLKRRGLK